jgi:uncharacterized protein YndB with AHSA1/START domain
MSTGFPDAVATLTVPHPPARVWTALTDPAEIKQYFLGTEVVTDWQIGRPIVWRGEWQGTSFEDHGTVLEFEPRQRFSVTHYSPLTGLPDIAENYHTVTYTVEPAPEGTTLTIRQGRNRSEGESVESEKMWRMIIANLDQYLAQSD